MRLRRGTSSTKKARPYSEAGMYEVLVDEALEIMTDFINFFEPRSEAQRAWIARVKKYYELIEKMEKEYEEAVKRQEDKGH